MHVLSRTIVTTANILFPKLPTDSKQYPAETRPAVLAITSTLADAQGCVVWGSADPEDVP